MRTSSGKLQGLVKAEALRWWNDSKSILLFFSVAWPIMLEGLELVAMYLNPIYPAPLLRDKVWSWTNPWMTWCPSLNAQTTDFSHDYCYGSNIAHFGGPYSLMWYWTMYAVALGGRFYPVWNNLTGMIIINLVFTWRLRRRYPGLGLTALPNTLYAWISLMFLAAWPQILLTLFFTTGSLLTRRVWLRISLLTLAVLYRLPILAPGYVWNFILHYSLRNPWNYIPYSLTATIWIFATVSLIGDIRGWRVAGKYAGAGACLGVLSFVGGWVALIYQEPGEASIASDWPIRILVGIMIVSCVTLIGLAWQRTRVKQSHRTCEA